LRTRQGMDAARRRGSQIGRSKKLSETDIEVATTALDLKVFPSLSKLAEHFHVHAKTLERALHEK